MQIDVIREPQAPPPVQEVIIRLTPNEYLKLRATLDVFIKSWERTELVTNLMSVVL